MFCKQQFGRHSVPFPSIPGPLPGTVRKEQVIITVNAMFKPDANLNAISIQMDKVVGAINNFELHTLHQLIGQKIQ